MLFKKVIVWRFHNKNILFQKIDSIKTSTLPLHRSLRIAYDPVNNCIVLFESYTAFYPKIHKYDLQNQNIETVNLQLEEYEFSNYKSINIEQIFIDPNGRIYFTLNTIDLNDKKVFHFNILKTHKNR